MNQSVYFLDIDDCLIRTSQLTDAHLVVMKNQLLEIGSQKLEVNNDIAEKIIREFAVSFRRMYDAHQGIKLTINDQQLLTDYLIRLATLEKPVVEKYGEVKRWSREICLFIAAQKSGITLTNHQIISITDALWAKITQYAIFYPDSKPFLDKLIKRNIPFYLITSSDSRLTLDDTDQLFHYDPEYSRNLKMKRLKIFTDLGIPEENIFIGDPYDKPKTWVFEQALNKAKSDIHGSFQSFMIGDSVNNDLLPAQKAGMDKLIWLNRYAKLEKELEIKETHAILTLNSLASTPGVEAI